MTIPIRWANRARTDLDKIDDHYAQIDRDIADRMVRAAVAEANFLALWPQAGSLVGNGPRRKWNVKTTPYILIYTPRADHIRIQRVRHARENWKPRA
jgi:toxin ParE1/3/4